MLIEAYDASVIFPISIATLLPTIIFLYLLPDSRGNRGDRGFERKTMFLSRSGMKYAVDGIYLNRRVTIRL